MKGTILEQVGFQLRMQENGLNLVTCGECGSVFIHETKEEQLVCPFCKSELDKCNAGDYFYKGMEG